MPRLFSALHPARPALEHLAAALDGLAAGPGLRLTPAANWHVTLCFYGEDDLDQRAAALRAELAGRSAPRLRLAGAGTFPGVGWVGVQGESPAQERALTALAVAAGARAADYRPHLTVARRPHRDRGPTALEALLADYTGPWFTADQVALMRSEPGPRGPVYHLAERFPLALGAPERGRSLP